VEIKNPGCLRTSQLIENVSPNDPIRRVAPDPRPRNPKLAQTLSLFNKWEGQGIGMSTLVALCLDDRIDLPVYRIQSYSEVTLILRSGSLIDDEMRDIFRLYDRFISDRLKGRPLREEEKIVLAYVIKARRADERGDYSIILTGDHGRSQAIASLERSGLIARHKLSDSVYAIYVPDPELTRYAFEPELVNLFGEAFQKRTDDERQVLTEVFKHFSYSINAEPSARGIALNFFHSQSAHIAQRKFEDVYREVKRTVEKLRDSGFLKPKFAESKSGNRRIVGYSLNRSFLQRELFDWIKPE
jgi:hypothetical protein